MRWNGAVLGVMIVAAGVPILPAAIAGCGNDREALVSDEVAADPAAKCTAVRMVSPVSGATLQSGSSIALQAEVTCPAGVAGETQFWVKPSGAKNWTVLPGYTTTQATWAPPSEGAWNVTAVARSVGSTVNYDVRGSSITVSVVPIIPACTVTIAGPDSAIIGPPIELTATSSCTVGTPEVQWWYRVGNHAFVAFQPFTTSATADFATTNSTPGAHQFFARVRGHGTTQTFSSNTLDVAVSDAVASCTAVVVDAPIDGEFIAPGLITLQATASCPAGVTPEYQFWVKQVGDKDWTVLPGYVTGASSFTPAVGGAWAVSVVARSIGSHVAYQARANSVAVTVTDAPKATDDALLIDVNEIGMVNVLANDYDPNGDTLTASIAVGGEPAHGDATLSAEGDLTYTPALDFHGVDAITYTVDDGNDNTGTATVFITINDAPVAVDDVLATPQDTEGSVDLLGNDFDPNGDVLTVVAFTQGGHGSVSVTAGVASYLPETGYTGDDSFTYTVEDPFGGSATATVLVTVLP